MTFVELLLLAVGLAMDACAVTIADTICYPSMKKRQLAAAALMFGLMQGLMPLLGYLTGSLFAAQMALFDHWIIFVLLAFLGGKMVMESRRDETPEYKRRFGFGLLLAQGIATSLDAFAVGVGFAAIRIRILPAVSVIAAGTALLCLLAGGLGRRIGSRLGKNAELFGGCILIGIGLKLLLEHLLSGS